eukprot:4895056-Alexandrium_andersonii.AAC.1
MALRDEGHAPEPPRPRVRGPRLAMPCEGHFPIRLPRSVGPLGGGSRARGASRGSGPRPLVG